MARTTPLDRYRISASWLTSMPVDKTDVRPEGILYLHRQVLQDGRGPHGGTATWNWMEPEQKSAAHHPSAADDLLLERPSA